MSFNTWKKEFYSPISKVAKKNAAAHSLKKWIGLRPENLEKHGLTTDHCSHIVDAVSEIRVLEITDQSCSLCRWSSLSKVGIRYANCNNCEYHEYYGKDCDDYHGPYNSWTLGENPEPMIKALQRLVDSKA